VEAPAQHEQIPPKETVASLAAIPEESNEKAKKDLQRGHQTWLGTS
jgi:hypothetical protein